MASVTIFRPVNPFRFGAVARLSYPHGSPSVSQHVIQHQDYFPKDFALQPLPETPDGVQVSEPERALLEMLSEVGVQQGVEEARNIMEGARSLRSATVASLLKHCQRVKVRMLCVQWAEELNLPWAVAARTAVGKHGQRRWNFQFKNGTALNIRL